jgi:hypothetical protein
MGDAAASDATFGFAFRGARIVSATITALMRSHGLGASGVPERLLLGGCSAGGRGVLTNLDTVAAMVPANVQVRGLLDAAGWVDVQPIIPDMMTLQNMTELITAFATPALPEECVLANQGAEWRCAWPSVRLPYVKTPYFLNAAQFDAFQIMYDSNNLDSTYCCETAPEQSWVEGFQTATLAMLAAVPAANGVYSSTCLVHCLSCNEDFYLFTSDGLSLAAALAAWFFEAQPVRQVSKCTGWDCTLACSGGPWMPSNAPCATTTNQCANDYYLPGLGGSVGGPPPLPPGMSVAQAGDIAWSRAQARERHAAAVRAGNLAWSAHVKRLKDDGLPVPMGAATGGDAAAGGEATAHADVVGVAVEAQVAPAAKSSSEWDAQGVVSYGDGSAAVTPDNGDAGDASVHASATGLSDSQNAALRSLAARGAPPGQ